MPPPPNTFSLTAETYIAALRRESRHSSAHIYECALRSFQKFLDTTCISHKTITPQLLANYETHLEQHSAKPNTVSTYLRMLRSIYYRTAEKYHFVPEPKLFHRVFTGIDTQHKRALPAAELSRLLFQPVTNPMLRQAQLTAQIAFQLCGIPFADLCRLTHKNVANGILSYRRRKTGTRVVVELLPSTRKAIQELQSLTRSKKSEAATSSPPEASYLLPLLPSSAEGADSATQYRIYTSVLREFNRRLALLAAAVGIDTHVSTYTLRHSWATLAKYEGSPVEAISEMLGHTSIRTTQIYLKGFELNRLTQINARNLKAVQNAFLPKNK